MCRIVFSSSFEFAFLFLMFWVWCVCAYTMFNYIDIWFEIYVSSFAEDKKMNSTNEDAFNYFFDSNWKMPTPGNFTFFPESTDKEKQNNNKSMEFT